MSKALIIAEKPSVATDLARILGKFQKRGDTYENEDYIIASALGHIVELPMPDDIDKKLKAWRIGSLPIIPEKFELKPSEKTRKKFQELKKLMGRKDVDRLINACDAGREGELIFTYIYEAAKCKKPTQRLWMVSMTPDSIRSAFNKLRDEETMKPLQEAARCRSESDWLIGINGTRAFTTRMYGNRGRNVATVGRVQTPTLTMVIEREKEIHRFKPRSYWKVVAQFQVDKGEYEGVFQKADFVKNPDDEHDRADRIWDRETAEKVHADAQSAGSGPVEEKKKRTRQSAPRLYDLTSLQREANGRYGLPAGKTLRIAQALYEKHKMITYPRTDSKALPEDYGSNVKLVLQNTGGENAKFAKTILEKDWVRTGNKKVFNNKQVSDHFAIIPTESRPKSLSDDEAKIFDMIQRRFLAVFFPSAEFDVTTRSTHLGEHRFKTEGKVLVKPGWLEVYGKITGTEDTLPPLSKEDGDPPTAKASDIRIDEDETRPPPRFTESTLLAAMEGAGKLLEDEDLADAMKEKGLGTPATRAAIIDQLINQKYIERIGRELHPTPKAEDVINFINAVKVEDLTSPSMTGEWEYKLNQVEKGQISRDEFMDGIIRLTKQLVERTRNFEEPDKDLPETELVSPTDNKPMLESLRSYRSQDGELTLYKIIGNRRMSVDEYQTLLEEGKVGPLDNFKSKAGKPYSTILKLEENKLSMDFGNSNGQNGEEDLDLSQYEVIGEVENGGKVYATPNAYVSEKHHQGDRSAFRLSRTLLGKSIPEEEVKKLLHDKKTGLIEGFRSKRNGRMFSAFLILKDNGSIGFEFPPRPPSKKKSAVARKKKK